MTGETPEVRSDKMRRKRKRRKKRKRKRGKERERDKKRKKRREKDVQGVDNYQSAFNSQKEKLNILAEMLEISKSGRCCCWIYSSTLSL